jgi:signal transduction histidine kinase
MRLGHGSPIAKRLTMMNMLVSGVALLLACASFFAYDQYSFRRNLAHTLSAQAQIVGANSVSALTFNDPQSAANTLAALRSSPSIAVAAIIAPDGKVFAKFARDASADIFDVPSLPEGQQEEYWFRSNHLILVRQIVFHNKDVGRVYIRADLKELDDRLYRYAAIALAVLLVSLIAAFLVSTEYRKSLAQPIAALSEVARTVSRDRDYSVRAVPSGEGGEVALLVDAFNDMLAQIQERDTALLKAHDELEQRVEERTRDLVSSVRELEAFSYSVSHDLRGPLEIMSGFSYMLQKNYGAHLDANGKESIEAIRTAVRRMSELIDDLLKLSRVSTGAMERQTVDLSAIAQSVVAELVRTQPERQIDFVIAPTHKTVGDPRLLQIVVENLLRNAWKYTSRHAQARVEFGERNSDGQVTYFVRDDGAGFDPELAGRLFKPFQRLHSTSQFPGSGVGLATVQRIIQRHRGEVWAEAGIEQGATFYFTLGLGGTSGRGKG